MAIDKTTCENTDAMRIYNYLASMNNTTKTDKIARQV